MQRREFLRLAAVSALALSPLSRAFARAGDGKRVVIIGAGILGSAIGYELAKRGAQVTILEKNAPASGATRDSFAYLNASTKVSARPYFDLNWQGLSAWRAWQQEAGAALPLQWNGSVYWRDQHDAAQQLLQTVKTLQARGYAAESVDTEALRRLLPSTRIDPASAAAFYPEEGAVDPVGAVNALLARAKQHGATLIHPIEVSGFVSEKGRVRGVRTTQGDISADTVVVTAGFHSQALLEHLDIRLPLTSSTGVLLHTTPQPHLLDQVVFAPGSTFRQKLDGRLISSSGHEGAELSGNPDDIGQQILRNAARYLPQIGNAGIERVSFGQRVIPADTLPIIGFAPKIEQLYVSVTHSGITLAPVLARIAATEILDGVNVELAENFRPQRFAG